MVFATNCVGHQVLVILLLPLLKNAVLSTEDTSDARIIVTSSSLHLVCRQLNLDLLTSPARIKRWPAIWDAVWRYGRSKLGNILFANELSRRLQQDRDDPASKHIYVNAYFPGNIATDQWLAWSAYMGKFIGGIMSRLGSFFGQSLEEGAATAIYLAASERVREQDQRGQYFVPIATPCEPSSLARNTKLARDVWVSLARVCCIAICRLLKADFVPRSSSGLDRCQSGRDFRIGVAAVMSSFFPSSSPSWSWSNRKICANARINGSRHIH